MVSESYSHNFEILQLSAPRLRQILLNYQTIMKPFNFGLVAIAALPFSLASSIYDCITEGTYKVWDLEDDPLLPTGSQQNWASSRLKTSYNAVHSTDFNMNSEDFDTYTYEPDRRYENKLRGSVAAGSNILKWHFMYKAQVVIGCTLCSQWDDDDGFLSTESKLDASSTHNRWVAAWCDELQQGPHPVFQYAFDCAIDLYNCVLSSENPTTNGTAPIQITSGEVHFKEPVTVALEEGESVMEESTGAEDE